MKKVPAGRGDGGKNTTFPAPAAHDSKNLKKFWGDLRESSITPAPPSPVVHDSKNLKKFLGDMMDANAVRGSAKTASLDKPSSIPPPKTIGEARKSAWWGGYEKAIECELGSLIENQTWDVVPLKELPLEQTF